MPAAMRKTPRRAHLGRMPAPRSGPARSGERVPRAASPGALADRLAYLTAGALLLHAGRVAWSEGFPTANLEILGIVLVTYVAATACLLIGASTSRLARTAPTGVLVAGAWALAANGYVRARFHGPIALPSAVVAVLAWLLLVAALVVLSRAVPRVARAWILIPLLLLTVNLR